MAPLHYAAKFDPFLSLDCAGLEGSNLAIWPPWTGEGGEEREWAMCTLMGEKRVTTFARPDFMGKGMVYDIDDQPAPKY